MEMIVYEILENSKKFHPNQDPHVDVCIEGHSNDDIQVRFLDDGQSMTAEQITRAKLPYSQSENGLPARSQGWGLVCR